MTRMHSPRSDEAPSEAGGRAEVAYRHVRQNMIALLADGLPRPKMAVPTCPEWCVEELMAHMVEVCARVHARLTGLDRAPMTTRQVPELLDEWERLSRQVDRFMAGPDSTDRRVLVMDAFTHELDLRRALGAPPPVDHPALPVAMGILVKGFSASVRGHSLPALRIETEHGDWVAGEGEASALMAGPWYEVYLSLSGRRTHAQLRTLRWSTDPGQWLPAFTWGPFTVPDQADADAAGRPAD